MKIYFAGSIRGGRDDSNLYAKLVAYLEQYGVVLTEHVADSELTEEGQEEPTDLQIYEKDMGWLHEADLVVAEVTTPSLGVGYEIGRGEAAGTDVLCLYRDDANSKLSAMVSGNPNMAVKEYTDLGEAKASIDDFMNDRRR